MLLRLRPFMSLTISTDNYMPYVAALFVPLVVAGMVTRFFKLGDQYPNGIPCSDPQRGQASTYDYTYWLSPTYASSRYLVYGPSSRISTGTLQHIVPPRPSTYSTSSYPQPNYDSIPVENSLQDFTNYVAANMRHLSLGGFYYDANAPMFAWSSGYSGVYQPAFLQSLFDGAQMNQTITFGYQQFRPAFTPSNGVGGLIATFTALGFAIYPAFFALYPTAERLRKVRAMHFSSKWKCSYMLGS